MSNFHHMGFFPQIGSHMWEIKTVLCIMASWTFTVIFSLILQNELNNLRQTILTLLGHSAAEVTPIVNKLTFAQCTYLLSVYRLEVLRVHEKKDCSFIDVFQYLEDKAIMKDKAGMWQCLLAVSDEVVNMYVDILSNAVSAEITILYLKLKSGKLQ